MVATQTPSAARGGDPRAAAGNAASAEILKSPQDKRLYRRIVLANGLEALLISDPEMAHSLAEDEQQDDDDEHDEGEGGGSDDEEDESDDDHDMNGDEDGDGDGSPSPADDKPVKKAAAAMVVGVGSLSDPANMQGLSHYLEHMLFMGSEQFPDENDYDSFLSKNGGGSNAYTELEYTNYQFDCKPAALFGALERFAQFFVAPLCKADALEREVNAVDNEFTGVRQSDDCRLSQLRCHTAVPGHVFQQFSWGNRKSLYDEPRAAGVPIRDEIVRYYKQHYSAERMSLVVLGGQDLDALADTVQRLFSGVPAGRGPRPEFSSAGRPFKGGRIYVMPAVKDAHTLCVTFQLPPLLKAYRKKADEYLSHLIGHEGRGSLFSLLKERGWATQLCAGVGEGGYERNSAVFLFDVNITLTEAGLAAGSGLGLKPAGLLFEFLAMLQKAGPQRWAFDELAKIAEMKFRFAEEEDACEYVTRLAADMPMYAPEHALKGGYLYDEWDADLVRDLVDGMTPRSARLDLQTRAYDTLTERIQQLPDVKSGTEPWFELPFVAAAVPEALLSEWEACTPSPELALPPRNSYLPTDFSLRAEAAMQDQNGAADHAVVAPPQLVCDVPGLRLWHKMDAEFRTPRANAYFLLTSPTTYDSPRAAALTHLTIKLLEDTLCETAYLADVAGLQYDVSGEGLSGLDVKLHGFSDKLPALTDTVFKALAGFQVEAGSFERVREGLARKYRNANMRPEQAAGYMRLLVLRATVWHVDAVLAVLDSLQPADVQAFVPRLLRELYVEALVHGNLTQDEAKSLAESVRSVLPAANWLSADARPEDHCTALQPGTTYLFRAPTKNAQEQNSVVELYLQCEQDSIAARARIDLIDQMMGEPCYDTLRTKQQLGYSVHSGTRLTHGILGFCIVVASGTHGPVDVERRIEAFLADFARQLEAMDGEDFERHRSALIASKMQKDRSLGEEADRHWEQIFNRRYEFQARQQAVAELRPLSQAAVLDFYRQHFSASAPGRRKLVVHVVGQSQTADLSAAPVDSNAQLVGSVEELKAGLPQHPAAARSPPESCLAQQ